PCGEEDLNRRCLPVFSADSRRLLYEVAGGLCVYEISSGRLVAKLPVGGLKPLELGFTDDRGEEVVATLVEHRFVLWDLRGKSAEVVRRGLLGRGYESGTPYLWPHRRGLVTHTLFADAAKATPVRDAATG